MSEVSARAERCLVAACAYLSMSGRCDVNQPLWVGVIRDVLPDCEGCGPAMIAMRVLANEMVRASPGRPRQAALIRLRHETAKYYSLAAAQRYEAWQEPQAAGP